MNDNNQVFESIRSMFDEDFEVFKKMLASSLDNLRNSLSNNETYPNDDVLILSMSGCENRLRAYARIAKEVFRNESLEGRLNTVVNEYAINCIRLEKEIEGEKYGNIDYEQAFRDML